MRNISDFLFYWVRDRGDYREAKRLGSLKQVMQHARCYWLCVVEGHESRRSLRPVLGKVLLLVVQARS